MKISKQKLDELLKMERAARHKKAVRCIYLGEVVMRQGIAEKVKCNCKKSKGYREQWHSVHTCHAPEHRRNNGKPGRCLPTFRGPFDADHQLEASIYKSCHGCEVRKNATATHS